MKILTNILNFFAVILVILGIVFIIQQVGNYKHRNDIDPKDEQIDSLDRIVTEKSKLLHAVNKDLFTAQSETNKYRELWLTVRKKLKAEKANQERVKNLCADEMLEYILDYFNTDTTSAQLIQDGDTIYVIMQPKLVHDIGVTIAKYEDNLELLDSYDIYISVSDSLINKLEIENKSLRESNSLLSDINTDLKDQNNMYKTSREEKEKQIKRLKLQRNIIGIGSVVLIVLIAL